jgi:hypothetical protein
MKEEDKDLLLRDLCARLPYEVKCKIGNHNYVICDISLEKQYDVFHESGRAFPIGVIGAEDNGNTFYTDVYEKHVKPYLFPLSSMTEEQEVEYDATFATIVYEDGRKDSVMTYKSFDWLNKNHFDYRGLIPKGLAIDATNLGIYK